ncbi:MAG: hypothetical protein AB1540_12940 [Bdellovibrionota bacterium]
MVRLFIVFLGLSIWSTHGIASIPRSDLQAIADIYESQFLTPDDCQDKNLTSSTALVYETEVAYQLEAYRTADARFAWPKNKKNAIGKAESLILSSGRVDVSYDDATDSMSIMIDGREAYRARSTSVFVGSLYESQAKAFAQVYSCIVNLARQRGLKLVVSIDDAENPSQFISPSKFSYAPLIGLSKLPEYDSIALVKLVTESLKNAQDLGESYAKLKQENEALKQKLVALEEHRKKEAFAAATAGPMSRKKLKAKPKAT